MDLKSAHIELLLHGREERNLEYKTTVDFSAEPTKALLTRAIAAHANTRDGGNIVVGMEKNGESYERVGILVDHLATLKVDWYSVQFGHRSESFRPPVPGIAAGGSERSDAGVFLLA